MMYDGKVSQHSEKAYERKVPIRQKVTSCRVRPELQNESNRQDVDHYFNADEESNKKVIIVFLLKSH